MELTMEILNKGRSDNGSWSWPQLKCFGLYMNDNPGWLERGLGTEITQEQVDKFMKLKNKHLKKNNQKFKQKHSIKKIRDLPEWIIENCYDDQSENSVVDVSDLLDYFGCV